MTPHPNPTQTNVLPAWSWNRKIFLKPIKSGLINASFTIAHEMDGEPFAVLQRLNTDIFHPDVNKDIGAITRRLQQKNLLTPTLIGTKKRQAFHVDELGQIWRCMTWVGKRTIEASPTPREVMSAARLVAKFHIALHDFQWKFRFSRPDAHNTPLHMAKLQKVLHTHRSQRFYRRVLPLIERILDHWAQFESPPDLPKRIIHGDLKISNIRFNGSKAVALIDLDTLGVSTIDVELGDALRSWCNQSSEDAEHAHIDLEIFEAALRGYARMSKEGPGLSDEEWESIVPGLERISLELSARFARDTLEESYFGWDKKYRSRSAHNLVRAKGQYALALAVNNQRSELEAAVNRARKAR